MISSKEVHAFLADYVHHEVRIIKAQLDYAFKTGFRI